MRRFPGQVLLEPADLGFADPQLVPVSTTVSGLIFPALAAYRFDYAEIWVTKTAGASVSVAIDILPSIDGVNVIGSGITPVGAVTVGAGQTAYSFFDATNALSVGGITVTVGGRFAFFHPYYRLDLRNGDAVNTATLRVRLFFGMKTDVD